MKQQQQRRSSHIALVLVLVTLYAFGTYACSRYANEGFHSESLLGNSKVGSTLQLLSELFPNAIYNSFVPAVIGALLNGIVEEGSHAPLVSTVMFNNVTQRNVALTSEQGYKLMSSLMSDPDIPTHVSGRLFSIFTMARSFASSRKVFLENLHRAPEHTWSAKIRKPIVIAGTGRGGTTFLHRLLAMDPENMYLTMGDMMFQASVPEKMDAKSRDESKERRIREATETIMGRISTNAFKVFDRHHYTRPWLPEEESLVMFQFGHILSYRIWEQLQNNPRHNTTAFSKWFDDPDVLEDVYFYLYRFLQHQQVYSENLNLKRWVLKAPFHGRNISLLLQYMPDAHVVFIHRPIESRLTSLGNLLDSINRAAYRPNAVSQEDFLRASKELTFLQTVGLRDYQAQLENSSSDKPVTHLSSDEVIRNPIRVVEKIYAQLHLEVSPEFRARMEAFLAADKLERHARSVQGEKVKDMFPPNFHVDSAKYIDPVTEQVETLIHSLCDGC